LGLWLGLGLLAKHTFLYMLPLGVLAVILAEPGGPRAWRAWIRPAAWVVLPALVLWSVYYLAFPEARTALAYTATSLQVRPDALSWAYLSRIPVPLMVTTFYASFGWANVAPPAVWAQVAFGLWGLGAALTAAQSVRPRQAVGGRRQQAGGSGQEEIANRESRMANRGQTSGGEPRVRPDESTVGAALLGHSAAVPVHRPALRGRPALHDGAGAAPPRAAATSPVLRALAVLGVALVLGLAGVVRFNLAMFQPQGRFLFPVLSAWAIVGLWGAWQALPARGRTILGSAVVGGMLAFNLYALFFALWPAYAAAGS
jgi:hypothetical protein